MPSRNSRLLLRRAEASIMCTTGKLPTIELSFCRSLCRPRPLAARCSRMTAIARFDAVLAAELARQREAQVAGAVGAAAHLGEQLLPLVARTCRRSPSRCAPTRGGGRSTACARARAGLISALDEGVELVELGADVGGDLEVHRCFSLCAAAQPTISTAIAVASPPPMQMRGDAARQSRRCRNAETSVTRIRAPEAPIGWPIAQAPPFTLTRSLGRCAWRMAASATTAKASLTSHRSTSPTFQPTRPSS